ncbi:MAG TPA: type VI secretion system protein TssA [Terriglobales bacterium]|nr:type VI secretion system protein TssA [Terriglobales bacterium]
MPLLRDDLLTPIPGSNPSGESLRYDPVYDKIKEARQEDDDDAPQGEWQRARKKADFPLVIKLAGEALSKRSKDLQLVAWLGEAVLRREGFAALPECITLFRSIQDQFWDTCYPEIEDGSPELRCSPQEWFASRCDYILRRLPLANRKGLDWIKYRESRTVASEQDAEGNDAKREAREEAIRDGKLTPEEWDEGFSATPKSFYEQLSDSISHSLEAVGSLDNFCDEKYGADSPNLGKLRGVLQEVQITVNVLLNQKREIEPDAQGDSAAQQEEQPASYSETSSGTAAAAPARAKASLSVAEPTSPEAAMAVALRAAEYLRKQDASLVAPYLVTRAICWGELRWQGDSPDETFLASPSTEVRQALRQFFRDSNWEELLRGVEDAMSTPCGRAWIDLQRYAWESCYNLSYSAVAKAICSETRALLEDYPSLLSASLSDGTAAADQATRDWVRDNVMPAAAADEAQEAPAMHYEQPEASHENGKADYFDAAFQLARSGRVGEAIEDFSREAAREVSGRERFRRQMQLAQICLSTRHEALAYPILQSLAQEVERRNLLDWEEPAFLAQVLAMLVQCIDRTTKDHQERARAYGLLCRLGPAAALQLEK